MARLCRFWFCLLSVLVVVSDFVVSIDPLKISPNLAPVSDPADSPFSSPPSISVSPASAPENGISSPPAPSPVNTASGPSPSHSPFPSPSDSINNSPAPSPFGGNDVSDVSSPVPSPFASSDINHVSDATGSEEEGHSEGMSGIKKVGITVGVVVGAGLVGLGGFVYKKRQENIRRSRYAYAAGQDLL